MPQTKLQHRVAFSIIDWACLFEFVSAVVVLILSVLTIYITSSTENMHSLHHHQEGTFKRSEISATWLSYVLSIARNASAVFQTQTIVSSPDEASEYYWILNRKIIVLCRGTVTLLLCMKGAWPGMNVNLQCLEDPTNAASLSCRETCTTQRCVQLSDKVQPVRLPKTHRRHVDHHLHYT